MLGTCTCISMHKSAMISSFVGRERGREGYSLAASTAYVGKSCQCQSEAVLLGTKCVSGGQSTHTTENGPYDGVLWSGVYGVLCSCVEVCGMGPILEFRGSTHSTMHMTTLISYPETDYYSNAVYNTNIHWRTILVGRVNSWVTCILPLIMTTISGRNVWLK